MLLEVVLILSLGLSCWHDPLLIMAKGQDQVHSLLLPSKQPLSAVDLDYLKIPGEVWVWALHLHSPCPHAHHVTPYSYPSFV